MTPQGPVTARRPALENLSGIFRIDYLAASGAKFVQRKHDFRRSRGRKTDGRRSFVGGRANHKTPPPNLAPDQSFGLQNVESSRNGRPVQANGLSQFPGWRNSFSIRHPAGQDRRTNLFMELPVKRRSGVRVEIKPGKHTNSRLTIPYWMSLGLRLAQLDWLSDFPKGICVGGFQAQSQEFEQVFVVLLCANWSRRYWPFVKTAVLPCN